MELKSPLHETGAGSQLQQPRQPLAIPLRLPAFVLPQLYSQRVLSSALPREAFSPKI
jgi:hypothetical protein